MTGFLNFRYIQSLLRSECVGNDQILDDILWDIEAGIFENFDSNDKQYELALKLDLDVKRSSSNDS